MKRIYVPPQKAPPNRDSKGPYRLPDDQAHYVQNVLRMSPGQKIELFDGTGRWLVGQLVELDSDRVVVLIEQHHEEPKGESPLDLTLVQAVPKGKRWRWILEKATELGVGRIIPIETEHTVVSAPKSKRQKKLGRWRRICASAARQCGRTVVPKIWFQSSIERARQVCEAECQVLASTHDNSRSLRTVLDGRNLDSLSIWIGPEGGFSDAEVDDLVEAGIGPCHLGTRICRTETAAIASISIAQSLLGDLK